MIATIVTARKKRSERIVTEPISQRSTGNTALTATGDVPTLVWLTRVESIATWNEVQSRMLEDAPYVELYQQAYAHVLDDGVTTSWLVPWL